MELQELLQQIWTTDTETAQTTVLGLQGAPSPTDADNYEFTPLLAIVASGLTWGEAERMHAELKATVPGQMIYGYGKDPDKTGAWRIVKRDYDHVGAE